MTELEQVRRLLALHAQRYPKWEIQDAVKLLDQREFGPSHLSRPDDPVEALAGELSQAGAEHYAPSYTVEALGRGLCRLHLDPCRFTEADMPLLDRCLADAMGHPGSGKNLWASLGLLAGLAWDKSGPHAADQVEFFLTRWAEEGCPRLHHSEPYREAYHPHYRVIPRDLAAWGPALRAISQALNQGDGPVIVAVDGRCAAGKTSFAQRLAQIFPCNVFHLDNYFLPADRRTEERLAQPGGNLDWERAESELLKPLSRGENVTVRAFDCADQALGKPKNVPFRRLNIVEGAYALHPRLAPYSQVHILFTCTPEVQLARLAQREDAESLERFCDIWIPLEETHLASLDLDVLCDAVIDTSRLPRPLT